MRYTKAVTFSYDDGVEQDERLVDLFNKYGMKCTFNINTGIQSEKDTFDIGDVTVRRLNIDKLKRLYQGHEVAVHGFTHAGILEKLGQIEEKYPKDTDKEKRDILIKEFYDGEFLKDYENIKKIFKKAPVGMAYAYGDYHDTLAKYLQGLGIRYGRTTISSHGFDIPASPLKLAATCHHNDDKLFELAEDFINAPHDENHPGLFYIWGHSYEFDVDNNWDRMENLCRLIGGRDDIAYITNEECL